MATWTPSTTGSSGSFDFGTTQSVGYNFKGSNPVIGNSVEKISLRLKQGGSPTGDLKCAIYDASGSLKSTSSDTIDISTITTSYVSYEWDNFPAYEIASTDFIVIYSDNMSAAGVVVEADTTSTDSTLYVGCRQTIGAAFSEFTRYAANTTVTYGDPPPPPSESTTTMPPPPAWVKF